MYPYTSSNHISGILTLYDGTNDTYKTVESDSNGNRIRDQGALYTYDLFNRLTSYTKDNVTTTYTYYPNGLRESKTTNNITTQFIWDGGNLVAEKAPDSYICDVYYIYGADGLAYRKDKNGSIYQYLVNFRGDVIAVLDENLNIKAEYIFDPYGEIYESNVAEGFTDNFGYRGQYHDAESGYIYLRMRYMDPSTGRFITEDPIRDGLNWFAYCEGNPIKYVDLWGLKLTLKGTGDEVQIMWNTIKEISSDKLVLIQKKDANGNLIDEYDVKFLEQGSNFCPSGTKLIKNIIDNNHTCTIVLSNGENLNYAINDTAATNGWLGSDVVIQFNPLFDPDVNTVGATTGNVRKTKRPSFIGLAHELIHADRSMNGKSIPYTQKANYKYKTARGVVTENVPKDELSVIGLSYQIIGGITENMIRKEHGLELRGSYKVPR